MKVTKKLWFSLFILFIATTKIVAQQDISIQLGANQIGLNQYFTITIQVKNSRLREYSGFPDINGFIKRGTSSSTTTNYVNGKMSATQSLTQNYQASKKGTFSLPPFLMSINGMEVKSKGVQIVVGEAIKKPSRRSAFGRDPFAEFFNRNTESEEFIDIEADAFVALSTSKKEIFVGEGFVANLSFYVAASNRAEMRFHDIANQITEIIKNIKPPNCWEENFSIEQIVGEEITIRGKNYTKYKIYETAYYPLTTEDIDFPSVGLKMIKYKIAKNRSFFGRNKQENFKIFYSQAKKVKVKDLPPHPLKDRVAVGDYQLDEKISTTDLSTGQSFNYNFNIIGEGNLSSIVSPSIKESSNFDFYPPNTTLQINRSNSKVKGVKKHEFYALPNEPGKYKLADYFSWIYFNPTIGSYDTLASNYILNVIGESRKNLVIASSDFGDFYDQIANATNELEAMDDNKWIPLLTTSFIVLILGFTGYLAFKKVV